MNGGQPKGAREPGAQTLGIARPSQLQSLGLGLALGAVGALPACVPDCDPFAFLAWIACIAAPAGAIVGARGVDPLRFAAVAPALWGVALALIGAGEEQNSLPTPAFGALAWTGLYFAGVGAGILWRSAAASAASLMLVGALLIGLPSRGGMAGEPWPPRAATVLLDLSPFVFLGECSGARDMAWHRSMYAPVGTDRFQRSPWNAPLGSSCALALGLCFALLVDRRRASLARTR